MQQSRGPTHSGKSLKILQFFPSNFKAVESLENNFGPLKSWKFCDVVWFWKLLLIMMFFKFDSIA